MKDLSYKPIIDIKSSTKILSEEDHKNLFDTIIKEKKVNHALRGIGVLASDRTVRQPFPLFTLEDLKKQYQRIITHYQTLGPAAESDVKALAHSVCQVIDLKTLNEIQEMVEDLYIKSLTDISNLWQHSDNFLINRNQLSIEELLYEKCLNDYAQQAVYGDFNKIVTVTVSDFLQQCNIISLLKNTIKKLEKPLKIVSTLATIKKIISWFENSGFTLKSDVLNALKKTSDELTKIQGSQTKFPTEIKSFMESLKCFLEVYNYEYQLSLYAIPKLIAANARYNSELQFRADLPWQMLPINLRIRCHRLVKKIKNHLAANPDAIKKLNMHIVEIPGNEQTNPDKIEYFTLAKIAQDLNIAAGFTVFIQDYCKKQFMPAKNAKKPEKQEKQRTENFLSLYDITFLVDDFMVLVHVLLKHLSKEEAPPKNLKQTARAIKKQKQLFDLKQTLNDLQTAAMKLVDCKKQLEDLTGQRMANPMSSSPLEPQITELEKTVNLLGILFKQEFQNISPKLISELIYIINQLQNSNLYENTAIGFLLLQEYANKKPQKLWREQAEFLGPNLSRHIILTLENPVLEMMKKYEPRKDELLPVKSRSLAEETLEKTLNEETLKISDTILKLYLNFCKYDEKTEKATLMQRRAKLSILTKQQRIEARRANELSIKYKTQFLKNYLDQIATLLKTSSNMDIIFCLKNLYCYAIAINDKKISNQIENIVIEHNLWEKMLSTEDTEGCYSLIHWAVYYNRRIILETLFNQTDQKFRSENANQIFTSEIGEKFSLLAFAVIEGYKESVIVLLKNGAELHTQNGKDKETALELAVKYNQMNIMQILSAKLIK